MKDPATIKNIFLRDIYERLVGIERDPHTPVHTIGHQVNTLILGPGEDPIEYDVVWARFELRQPIGSLKAGHYCVWFSGQSDADDPEFGEMGRFKDWECQEPLEDPDDYFVGFKSAEIFYEFIRRIPTLDHLLVWA